MSETDILYNAPGFVVRRLPDTRLLRVERLSPRTKTWNVQDLPITMEKLTLWMQHREPIQRVFPLLTADQREFILTGLTAEDWNILYPPENDDDP